MVYLISYTHKVMLDEQEKNYDKHKIYRYNVCHRYL